MKVMLFRKFTMDILNATVFDFVLFQKYSGRVISAGDVFTNTLEWKNIPGNISSHGSIYVLRLIFAV